LMVVSWQLTGVTCWRGRQQEQGKARSNYGFDTGVLRMEYGSAIG
jgi:hypothetical protein